MSADEEHKIARIFGEHYGPEDGLVIEQCIKAIILHEDHTYREKLASVLIKNGWSEPNAQAFADTIVEMGSQ